ncbi:MAG: hypothetical protein LBS37_04385 [Treponema sp.]|jgi:hypothetical protein|nr:hypothetical protein [Treponema sp.]
MDKYIPLYQHGQDRQEGHRVCFSRFGNPLKTALFPKKLHREAEKPKKEGEKGIFP